MITYNSAQYHCNECLSEIEHKVHIYSLKNYGYSLCRKHQDWYCDMLLDTSTTDQSTDLYFALKRRGVPALLENNDGHKTVDISVPDAFVNIEVDGKQHFNSSQALRDLKRSLHDFRKGIFTIHVPNALVQKNLEECADLLTEFLNVSKAKH